ncbi:sugar ABC transporter ATP-binding protein [Roseibium sediminis]|uniref:sugar ABC transporter ATP-binding protein n=1 Tax=Roseibium sediminis TaxID=1775174 RepID=UPI00123C81F9|nr:sugar ABC transporter ATP-binding protein [Roseibium sediminis]
MAETILELLDISKSFEMTHALKNMSLELKAGEVHAIVGENGAGKSTMIKIMTGVHKPTSGEIRIDGQARTLSGTQAAREAGIAAMYQEPMVFPDLDVAENIFISARNKGLFLKPTQQRQAARALVTRLGMSLDVELAASGLTLAEQQIVEIARALSEDVRVLIMDEPTASLSAYEASQLRRIAKTLAQEGVAVVYISHRLEEIFEIADRVTVIRDGGHISTRPISETTADLMIAEMVGRDVGNYFAKIPGTATDTVALKVRNLAVDDVFEGVNFDLHKGEVLCFSGLVGARRTDVALALFGVKPATRGTIEVNGTAVEIRHPKQAMDIGIAYVSEDRRKLGLAMPMSIQSNTSLATLGKFLRRFGLLDRAEERNVAEAFRKRLNIRTPNVDIAVGTLSGGNQQKVMLAKWLNMEPEILIFDEPTRGIDVGAKAEVHELIREFAKAGGAALVISSDLPEVMALGDRNLVMREGRQMGVIASENATQEKIMALATGQQNLREAS